MRLQNVVLVFAAAAVLAAQPADMGVMLQRAIRLENVQGDLNGAIDLYKKVVAGAKDRAIAAKALLGLGECYEKQGNAEAQKAYERLVKEFSDQAEAAHAAQARLTAMSGGLGNKTVLAQLVTSGPDIDLVSAYDFKGRVTADGKLYVYVDMESGNLVVRDLQSGAARRLTNDATGTEHGSAHASSPVPSRDGRQIAFVWNLATSSRSDRPAELRVLNMDGSGMHAVPVKLKSDVPLDVLDWGPDGKSLLVWASVPDNAPLIAWVGNRAAVAGQSSFGFAMVDIKTGVERSIARGYKGTDPSGLSPDGRWMVYSRQVAQLSPNWGVYAIDTQTGQEKAVIQGTGVNRGAMWVPDSDRIVFRSDRKGTNGIWMVRFKDGAAAGEPVLIKQDAGDYTPLGVTRDGSLFYGLSHESSDIYSVEVDPATLRAQGVPRVMGSSFPGRNSSPSWSPAGDSFAYSSDREGAGRSLLVVQHAGGSEIVPSGQKVPGNLPIWCGPNLLAARGGLGRTIYDATTGEAQSEQPAIKGVAGSYQAVVSPDCSSVYVSGVQKDKPGRRIYRAEIATGRETDLLVDAGEWAVFPLASPDERWLALYGRPVGSTTNMLMLLPAQGGSLRPLNVEGMNGWGFSWTSDSKRLLMSLKVKSPDGQREESELFWLSVDGGAPQSMGIHMSGKLSAPSLNPDGKRLLFSAAETSNEVWVLRNLPLK